MHMSQVDEGPGAAGHEAAEEPEEDLAGAQDLVSAKDREEAERKAKWVVVLFALGLLVGLVRRRRCMWWCARATCRQKCQPGGGGAQGEVSGAPCAWSLRGLVRRGRCM